MDCESFLAGYSEYRDGLLSPSDRAVFDSHLAGCETCQRYDRVVKQGTELVRSLPSAHASDDFLDRLKHRLYHVDDGIPLAGSRLGGSAALVGVAAVGLLALFWLPFAARVPVELELPPVAVQAPSTADEVPALFRPGPFLNVEAGPAWSPLLLGEPLEWALSTHERPATLISDRSRVARAQRP